MAPSTRTLKIGIIGFGPFAQFLAKTMIKQGHLLTATSRSDHSGHHGVHFFRDMEEFIGLEHDVILICTSILSTSEVIKSIPFHRLKKPTLFADVLSVKEYPRKLLLQEVPEDSDLVCTHPMFGPESGRDGWRDLTFMYERVRVRDDDLCSSFLTIFECEGCKMLEMSCEEHDRLAAESQFLTHTIGSRLVSLMEMVNLVCGTGRDTAEAGHILFGGTRKREIDKIGKVQSIQTLKFPTILSPVNFLSSVRSNSVRLHTNAPLKELLKILSEMEIANTPIDTKGFEKLVQVKESTMRDSFDLYSGLFIHNRFAKQQLENLESAVQRVKETLEGMMSKGDGPKCDQ